MQPNNIRVSDEKLNLNFRESSQIQLSETHSPTAQNIDQLNLFTCKKKLEQNQTNNINSKKQSQSSDIYEKQAQIIKMTIAVPQEIRKSDNQNNQQQQQISDSSNCDSTDVSYGKRKYRKDHFGSIIEKGKKVHKISFKKDKELTDVIEVENWKNYNKFETEDNEQLCDCKGLQSCQIF